MSHQVLSPEKEPIRELKKRLSITIEEDLIKWMDNEVKKVEYRNRSHLIEVAVSRLKEKNE